MFIGAQRQTQLWLRHHFRPIYSHLCTLSWIVNRQFPLKFSTLSSVGKVLFFSNSTFISFVFSGIEDATVLVGTNNFELGGVRYKPREYVKHERFNESPLAYDIGILRVDKIDFNEKVQPINFTSNYVEAGVQLRAFGWGRLNVTKLIFPIIIFNSERGFSIL